MFARARWRLVASYTGLLALILLGLGIAVLEVFEQGLYTDIDSSLREPTTNEIFYIQGFQHVVPGCNFKTAAGPSVDRAEGVEYTVVDCHGNAVAYTNKFPAKGIYPNDIAQALKGRTSLRIIQHDNHYYRVLTSPIPYRVKHSHQSVIVGGLQIYRDVDEQVRSLQRLEQVLIGGGLAALILVTLAGTFMAGRTLNPIRIAFNRQRRFIADASHELRTPLTLIRSSAEMVSSSSTLLEPEDAELVDDIVNEADRMSRLVSDLLTLARVDNAQIALQTGPVDLGEVACKANEDVTPMAIQKQLVNLCEVHAPYIVIGDELRLRQLLLVLLDNAIKYSKPGWNRANIGVGT